MYVCVCVCVYTYMYIVFQEEDAQGRKGGHSHTHTYSRISTHTHVSKRDIFTHKRTLTQMHSLSLSRARALSHSLSRRECATEEGDTYVLVPSNKSKRQLHTLFRFSECDGGIGLAGANQHRFRNRKVSECYGGTGLVRAKLPSIVLVSARISER